jgi:branched-chain amino acid transport system ATP-binding protein
VVLLEVEGLVVRYGKALALDRLSLIVEARELVAVLGPNGAGRSTLLRAISRVVPSSGKLAFGGVSLQNLRVHEVVGKCICHCPEGWHPFGDLTALKNLQLGAYARDDMSTIAFVSCRRCANVANSKQTHSREQHMVAIGRALMGRPKLLLLDELSLGIARRLKQLIFAAVRQIQQSGTAVLLVKQDALSALSRNARLFSRTWSYRGEGTSETLAEYNYIRQVFLGVY